MGVGAGIVEVKLVGVKGHRVKEQLVQVGKDEKKKKTRERKTG